jgi:hypothetical protein
MRAPQPSGTPATETRAETGHAAVPRREFVARLARAAVVPAVIAAAAASTQPAFAS